MKNIFCKHLFAITILLLTLPVTGQTNRTLETKVVDVLAQLPTEDLRHSDRLMAEVIDLGEDGILEFTSRLVPGGQGDDVQARYLVNSLAIYAGRGTSLESQELVERALQKSIEAAADEEVKNFLLRRLSFCATEKSVGFLSDYLDEEAFYQSSLGVLEEIGSDSAGSAVLKAVSGTEGNHLYALVESLGRMRYKGATERLAEMSDGPDWILDKYVLRSLSEIASEDAFKTLAKAAQTGKYSLDDKEAVLSLINYGYRLQEKGNKELSHKVANNLLKNCRATDQLHFRSAGLDLLSDSDPATLNKTLLKEVGNDDAQYRGSVVRIADQRVMDSKLKDWIRYFSKASDPSKTQLVAALGKRKDQEVLEKCIIPSLSSRYEPLRIAAVKTLSYQEKSSSLELLLDQLGRSNSQNELLALEQTLLRTVSAEDGLAVARKVEGLNEAGQIVLIHVLAQRNFKISSDSVYSLVGSGSQDLDMAIYEAMGSLATSEELLNLLELLDGLSDEEEIEILQESVIEILDRSSNRDEEAILKAYRQSERPQNWLAVLAALNSPDALSEVEKVLKNGSEGQQVQAVQALAIWRNTGSIEPLFDSAINSSSDELRKEAFKSYLLQVTGSGLPDDQKLLLVRRISDHSRSMEEKKYVLRAASTIKTFLSLVFVSDFLDQPELKSMASNTAIRIALPTPTFEGLQGSVVRDIVSRSIDNLTGLDSQYLRIDVKEFLDNMPSDPGYLPIFNGNDLSGWQGLVDDPVKRSKMNASQLAKKQKKADVQMTEDWVVDQGHIKFVGEGFKNICTVKKFGDVEILVDWKIGAGGDSGIYLRGSPQVQIWDTALTEVGAEVGSGGLYNNEKNPSKPLVVADNPINQWNTFRIKIVDDVVTVYLNGVLVVDKVVMENYWDRNQALFPKEAIELQAHGEDVMFRNVYVKELDRGVASLSAEEAAAGFVSLFNGKNLKGWQGNTQDYRAENGELVVRPTQGEHGNLFTDKEYSDFILRFEFQLTPGANNGLGIHAPLEGDVAYEGKESQILDNTAEIYANLEPYQYHGSIYGVMTAKRGFLKPLGDWNQEEVIVRGDDIKITLNGAVILEGNLAEASKNGTLDGKDHPGLKRKKGYLAFLGHGSELKFRNIRLKDLSSE